MLTAHSPREDDVRCPRVDGERQDGAAGAPVAVWKIAWCQGPSPGAVLDAPQRGGVRCVVENGASLSLGREANVCTGAREEAARPPPHRTHRSPPRKGQPVMAARPKITVVGAGNVGASVAQYALEKELGDVVLIDVIDGVPQGKALDLLQAGPIRRYDSMVNGSNGYDETAGSAVVVSVGGLARKPGMTGADLLFKNAEIVGGVVEQMV